MTEPFRRPRDPHLALLEGWPRPALDPDGREQEDDRDDQPTLPSLDSAGGRE